jgi:hypothetical protein
VLQLFKIRHERLLRDYYVINKNKRLIHKGKVFLPVEPFLQVCVPLQLGRIGVGACQQLDGHRAVLAAQRFAAQAQVVVGLNGVDFMNSVSAVVLAQKYICKFYTGRNFDVLEPPNKRFQCKMFG